MKTVLVTGASGFIGRNLVARLKALRDVDILILEREESDAEWGALAARADVVFHLAGVNRPIAPDDFHVGNCEFTERLVALLREIRRSPAIVFSSSIQAEQPNPYGRSKHAAEEVLHQYARDTGGRVAIFRLKNVFGKWSRPNYNSVVATFCHNIARDVPITISSAEHEVELVYIDDVVDALVDAAWNVPAVVGGVVRDEMPSSRITLGALADLIRQFRDMRESLFVPDLSERFRRQLYATYLSFVESTRWQYPLGKRADERGDLAEFIKSVGFGQIFVSRTRPGITRGNHYHDTKTEKFLVLSGTARIRLRHVEGGEVLEFVVLGEEYRVVDIPPGYTHSITNEGSTEMITLFWASEVFDPTAPDTIALPVGGKEPGE